MDDDVLSQDEIDALLGESENSSEDNQDAGDIQLYDFSAQDKVIRNRMPTFEMICERFIRNLRVSLFNIYRKSPEVSFQGIELMKFVDYVHTLYVPTSLNIVKIKPLRGNSLFTLDAKLVFILVENYFGGTGRFYNKIEGRDFTNTENKLVDKVLKSIFADFKAAWQPVMDLDFDYQSREVNPSMASVVGPTELVIVCKFEIEMNEQGGEFHITIPYSMIEPIKEILISHIQAEEDEGDDRWVKSLKREAFEAEVNGSVSFCQKEITLKDLQAFTVGDVIPVEVGKQWIMRAGGISNFACKLGVYNGKYAIQVLDKIGDEE